MSDSLATDQVDSDLDYVPQRDEGSVLTMVLAFIIISSLIIVPMLTYAITVLRVNSTSVDKREDLEAVRGGARVAIADPVALFSNCWSETSDVTIPTPSVSATSTCRQIEEIGVTAALDVPFAAVATQVGQQISSQGFLASGSTTTAEPPTGAAADWWQTAVPALAEAEPAADTVWFPYLPDRETTVQDPDGHALPAPYDCRVYFPGTYESPVNVGGNTYFTSGVYYFEDNVTVVGGADAVAGFGLAEGCVGDLQAVLDISDTDRPDRFNIEGLGATMIFGDEARLIVDDTVTLDAGNSIVPNASNTPLRFEINQRYVQDADDGGARVSVMSVNGDYNPVTNSVGDLLVAGHLSMPESQVKVPGSATTELASTRGLVPSTHTPEARVPAPPTIVDIIPMHEPSPWPGHGGAARISWAAPVGNEEGGSTILQYEVFDNNGNLVCTTSGALECVAVDLGDIQGSDQIVGFSIVATNAIGASDPSASVPVVLTHGGVPRVQKPSKPTIVSVESAAVADVALVSWDAPAFDGFAPIVSYDVTAHAIYTDGISATEFSEESGSCSSTSFRDQGAPQSCVIALPELDTTFGAGPGGGQYLFYRFSMTASNSIPISTTAPDLLTSDVSDPFDGLALYDGSGTAPFPTPAPVTPVAPVYLPDPIVDINVSSGALSTVNIAGYVSTPQGHVSVVNPGGSRVALLGGIVSGTYAIDPTVMGSASTQSTTLLGFQNTVLQRKIAITTTLPGSSHRSILIVQINANGADVKVNSWVTQ